MIKSKIKFFYQEEHKCKGNLSTTQKTFTFKNEDEERGFHNGLGAIFEKSYQNFEDYEVVLRQDGDSPPV